MLAAVLHPPPCTSRPAQPCRAHHDAKVALESALEDVPQLHPADSILCQDVASVSQGRAAHQGRDAGCGGARLLLLRLLP